MATFTQVTITFNDDYCNTAIAPQFIQADFRPEHGYQDCAVITQTS